MQRSPRRNNATKRRSSTVPSTISTSSVPDGRPASCSLRSYWSDQNHGIGANGAVRAGSSASPESSASSRRAACSPISIAFSHCSTRITSPKRGFGQLATSPAATMPGAARQVSSQRTPSSSVSPEPSSQPMLGTTPTPTTTTSARTSVPSSRVRTLVGVSPSCSTRRSRTPTPSRTSTPSSRCSCVTTSPMLPGSTRPRGTSPASIIVTSRPRPRHVAATSAPMNPAPITATLGLPASSSDRIARQSDMVRSTCTPAVPSNSNRGDAPMASTMPSARIDEPSLSPIVRVAASSEVAATPRRRSTPSSGRRVAERCTALSGSQSPASTCFDRGGRSGGRSVDGSTMIRSPS